jgi:aryl-alcohol dehydrogenase-like predicted oxidoreductase
MDVVTPLLDRFVAAGGNAVDTAHVYGNGASERAIGEWLRQSGRREDILIISKGAHPDLSDWIPRVNPAAIAQDLAESLERLGVETIDLYLLHRDDESVPVGPLVDLLNEQVAAGRIRAFGASNWSHLRIKEANAYAAAHGLLGFAANSPQFSLAAMNLAAFQYPGIVSISADPAALSWYRQHRFPLVTWSSQAGGFFAGPAKVRPHFDTEDNRERERRARELAERHNCTTTQLALAWVLNQPLNIYAIFGTSKLAHLEDCLGALDVHLTPKEMAWLNLEREAALQAS